MKIVTVTLLMTFAVLGSIAFAQNEGTVISPIEISEMLAAVIGVVALLLAAATGYGVALQRLQGHISNDEIHHSGRALDDRFVLRTEIVDLKDVIKQQFEDLKDEIRTIRKEE